MSNKNSVTLNQQNFKSVIEDGTPVLVDFWADWCAPCRAVGPVVEELAEEFAGRAIVGKVDVDDQVELAREYGIRSIPSLLFFHGGEVIDRVVGTASKRELSEKLQQLVS